MGGVVLIIIGNHWYFGDSLSELGIRIDNFTHALRLVLPVTGLGMLLLLIAATMNGEYHLERWGDLLIYLPWALIQQHCLQNFLFRRFQNIIPHPILALICASILFAALHLPNLPLVVATLFGGLLWCWLFQRVPNLFAISISHTLLVSLALVFFKFSLFNQFQIGQPGHRYESFGDGVLVASGYDGTGEPFIATLPGHDRGHPSLVRLFRPNGTLLTEWVAFDDYEFSGNLAVGDLGYQEGDEIVVAPGPAPGNPALIRVFDRSGKRLSEFRATSNGYGAGVAIGNNSIVVTPGPAPGHSAKVMEYSPEGKLIQSWSFGELKFQNSIQALILEDIRGEKTVVLWGTPISTNPSHITLFQEPTKSFDQWDTYGTTYGLSVSRIRLADDSEALASLPGPLGGYQADLKVFDRLGHELYNFLIHEDPAACGGNLSSIDLNGDGRDEVLVGEGICPGRLPTVRIMDLEGHLIYQWDAY